MKDKRSEPLWKAKILMPEKDWNEKQLAGWDSPISEAKENRKVHLKTKQKENNGSAEKEEAFQ